MAYRVLVVDDEEAIAYAMQEYFSGLGYEVDCARELHEALGHLARVHYDVVIADLRLTGSHGAEGLEILARAHERSPGTRVILLTAYGTAEVEAEARRRGAHALLHKPRPLDEMARLVRALLEPPA